jgi:hypothetical protein
LVVADRLDKVLRGSCMQGLQVMIPRYLTSTVSS